ncbi:glutamine amidotransferase [Mycolicibacterium litorale]|uniref:Glutamine amidotransferase n=1 Tax=Mycolicibacterium litorale TaxID=758802 RepID=A0A6S6P4E3_9MYCO|nr:type 1 glutamine amidotransferase domain-containing protein [Mycolicibacterium litorale]BCI52267.1 glutamine amidotransferase [Mycolicibacterium litorale]
MSSHPERTRVVVLAADFFEESELIYPVLRLREEGYSVTVAGVGTAPVRGKSGYGPYPVDVDVADVDPAEVDALVVPGGFAPDLLRRSAAVLDLVGKVDADGKPVAFVCHGAWVGVSAGILKGRRLTSVSAIRDDLRNAGADWVDESVVVDRNLVTAQLPRDLGAWMRALIAVLS